MRTIIAGSRHITDYSKLLTAIDKVSWFIECILSGAARGTDKLGEIYALENNIPLEVYPAKWEFYGKAAGRVRNILMAERSDALIALWDGVSPGTGNMIDEARKRKLKMHVEFV